MLLIKGSLILAAVIISASAKGLDACNDLYDERVYSDIDDKKINQIYLITMTVLTMIGHLIRIVLAYIGFDDWNVRCLKSMFNKACPKKENKVKKRDVVIAE